MNEPYLLIGAGLLVLPLIVAVVPFVLLLVRGLRPR